VPHDGAGSDVVLIVGAVVQTPAAPTANPPRPTTM
jgi:hypothetical protein